jgi:hypothetical protein
MHRMASESAFSAIFHLQYICRYVPTYSCAAEGLPPLNPSYSRDAAYPPAFLGHHEYISHYITAGPRGGAMLTKKATSLLVPCQL